MQPILTTSSRECMQTRPEILPSVEHSTWAFSTQSVNMTKPEKRALQMDVEFSMSITTKLCEQQHKKVILFKICFSSETRVSERFYWAHKKIVVLFCAWNDEGAWALQGRSFLSFLQLSFHCVITEIVGSFPLHSNFFHWFFSFCLHKVCKSALLYKWQRSRVDKVRLVDFITATRREWKKRNWGKFEVFPFAGILCCLRRQEIFTCW